MNMKDADFIDEMARAKLITADRKSEEALDPEIEKMLRWPGGIMRIKANLIHADLRHADLTRWPSKEDLKNARLIEWEECVPVVWPVLH